MSLEPSMSGGSVRPRLDEASAAWVDGLLSSGSAHERCVAQLHDMLRRVARHELQRRAGSLGVSGPEFEDIADQAADDALMAIKAKVGEFRGDSRFTTWAYRFVMLEVSTKVARHVWRHRPPTLDDESWERLPDVLTPSPQLAVEDRAALGALRHAIAADLTERQRRVFVAIALNQVPVDALARELGSNRNAVYKTLFDARRRLRASLVAAGYPRPDAGEGALTIEPELFVDLDEAAADVGCASGFELLHRYVEAKLAGDHPDQDLPGLAVHLQRCPACRADYEGLLEAAAHFGDNAPT